MSDPEVVVPDRRGLGRDRLGDRQRRACRRRALDDRVQVLLLGRREHLVVRLAVAALAGARRLAAAEVLVDDAVVVRRVEPVRADLERVAERAGGPERPVLGAARRVVEPVARDVRVAVVAGHPRAERLVQRLLQRGAHVGDARRTQHQVRERVVRDEVRDRARRLQLADVLDLRLRERRVAAERVAGPVRARAAAAPQAAVVAVGVGAAQAPGRVVPAGAARVLRRRVRRDPAVLALHLVVEQAEGRAEAGVLRLAREVEAVGVDDRHDDRARRVDEVRRAAARAVVGQQVVGELDRVLRRRPLTRVVDAELQEDRLAVPRGRVLRDLDAVDVAALDRLVVERQLLHEPRVAHGQLLELEVVVGEMAVLVAAAGQLGLRVRRRELRVGRRGRPSSAPRDRRSGRRR